MTLHATSSANLTQPSEITAGFVGQNTYGNFASEVANYSGPGVVSSHPGAGSASPRNGFLQRLRFVLSRKTDGSSTARTNPPKSVQPGYVSKLTDTLAGYFNGTRNGDAEKILAKLYEAECLIMDAAHTDINVDQLKAMADLCYKAMEQIVISPDSTQRGNKSEKKAISRHADRVATEYVRRAHGSHSVDRLGKHLDLICGKLGHVLGQDLIDNINRRRNDCGPSTSTIRHCASMNPDRRQFTPNPGVPGVIAQRSATYPGAMPVLTPVMFWSQHLQRHFHFLEGAAHPQDNLNLPHLKRMLQDASNEMEKERMKGLDVSLLAHEINQCHQKIYGKRQQILDYHNTLMNQTRNAHIDPTALHIALNSNTEHLKRFDTLFLSVLNPAASKHVEDLQKNFNFLKHPGIIPAHVDMNAAKNTLVNAMATMEQQRARGVDVAILRDEISRCHQLILEKGNEFQNKCNEYTSLINDSSGDRTSLLNYFAVLDTNLKQFNATFFETLPVEVRYLLGSIN